MLFQTVTAVLLLSLAPAWCKNQDDIPDASCFTVPNFPPLVPAQVVGQRFDFYLRNEAASIIPGQAIPTFFNTSVKTVFIVHGFNSDLVSSTWLVEMKDALLAQENMNVVLVGWAEGAKWEFLRPYESYCQAVANTDTIATHLRNIMRDIQIHKSYDPKNMHCIGHSLGAHVCGRAGRNFEAIAGRQIGRITGLDPARPVFRNYYHEGLQELCATFVDVIHTNGQNTGWYCRTTDIYPLGDMVSFGHVDFYPAGGDVQPTCAVARNGDSGYVADEDCPPPEIESLGFLSFTSCSHRKAYKYFIASITTPSCFVVQRRCEAYNNIPDGCVACQQGQCPAEMGYRTLDTSRGLFAMDVMARPYCNNVLNL